MPLAAAGGTNMAEAPIGTDPLKVLAAIEASTATRGVLVLMDVGSAIMSAEAAIDMLPPEQRARLPVRGPSGRGRRRSAVRAMTGGSIQQVLDDARMALCCKGYAADLAAAPAGNEAAAQQAATAAGIAGADSGRRSAGC